ncbi:MAG: hypothetical protein K2J80_00010 [Oscillospiraceae bacterium]|nr:hypothetical protein [Oscillospiraceae bacterium]
MSQDNWIKLDEKPTMMGWNFDQKGIRIGKDGNPNVKNIELTQEDMDKINNSELKIAELKPLRDCFEWNVTDPDEYIHRMTNQSDHTRHLDTYMRGEVEFNNFGENDIVKIMANAGKQIDRFYDIGVINDEEYATMNTAIENRTKDLVKQLYSCRAAIEERDICAKAFNQNNQRIYITEEEHTARMAQLYNKSSIKFDNILDMISKQRAAMWRDWLHEDWRVKP